MTLAIVNTIGQTIVDRIKNNIRAGLDVNDEAFAPLKDGSGVIPLNKTLELLQSITYRVDTTSLGLELILMFGTTYGKYHITGTRKMTSRAFMPNTNDMPKAWQKIIDDYVGTLLQVTNAQTFYGSGL
jgi:hypothetical protein